MKCSEVKSTILCLECSEVKVKVTQDKLLHKVQILENVLSTVTK